MVIFTLSFLIFFWIIFSIFFSLCLNFISIVNIIICYANFYFFFMSIIIFFVFFYKFSYIIKSILFSKYFTADLDIPNAARIFSLLVATGFTIALYQVVFTLQNSMQRIKENSFVTMFNSLTKNGFCILARLIQKLP
jgi:hypothetical protein